VPLFITFVFNNPMTTEQYPLEQAEFSRRVLAWFDQYGRSNLPWQHNPTPYRVWVSEIMLQQTQVATVIPYYQRFMARFPEIRDLADAHQDEVLHLWSGLGYYARARNLHHTAMLIRDRYAGQFPADIAEVTALPGIGRSTAGAILALSGGQRHAILDGNVKRVLARFQTITGWPGDTRVLKTLWQLAEYYTPTERMAAYTQAMMDLGATLCTRSRPHCELCPLHDGCRAHATGQETAFPQAKPSRERPVKSTRMIMARNPDGEVLLEKRPPAGVWGGLWGFPECPAETELVGWCRQRLGVEITEQQNWSVMRHSFSHFHLDITPVKVTVKAAADAVMEAERFVWYNIEKPDERGLAAPVQRLLSILATEW
jgi:A/G-specific adenine glycosylase